MTTEVELSAEELGGLLQELVNRVSHGQGKTLAVLDEASVTLQQALLLRRLQHSGQSTSSELAAQLHISLPAMSQMVDRLFELDLVTRTEMAQDRRKKRISPTAKARALLERVRRARSAEYGAALAVLAPKLRVELARTVQKVLRELPAEGQRPAAA
ncbi:MAG TPA: MarR family transcriptional regulator [Steroidobacteraceae bacterium]|nr:MarR family transcriptional regulator [Steroidobacteraceae bacterium]